MEKSQSKTKIVEFFTNYLYPSAEKKLLSSSGVNATKQVHFYIGAEHYNPQALRALENRGRNGNSTVARPPSPEDFQFTAPLERQRPQASSTPRPRPQDQPLGQLPDQLLEPTERTGMKADYLTIGI